PRPYHDQWHAGAGGAPPGERSARDGARVLRDLAHGRVFLRGADPVVAPARRTLRPRGELIVNGCALPMEMVVIPPRERIGAARTDQIPLFFKVSARQ